MTQAFIRSCHSHLFATKEEAESFREGLVAKGHTGVEIEPTKPIREAIRRELRDLDSCWVVRWSTLEKAKT